MVNDARQPLKRILDTDTRKKYILDIDINHIIFVDTRTLKVKEMYLSKKCWNK